MIKSILNDKKRIILIVTVVALVVIAAIVLVCTLSCDKTGKPIEDTTPVNRVKPLFEFETFVPENDADYPVACISATDFYAHMEGDSRYSDTDMFKEIFEAYNAKFISVNFIELSGTDFIGGNSGEYLEKNGVIYDVNYTNCEFYEYDIDGDGEKELVFYTCEISGKKHICTYFVLGTEADDIYWCRYNRAWAVGPSGEIDLASDDLSNTDISQITAAEDNEKFLVSLMLQGVENEVYGQLECDNSGEEPFYYTEAGEYSDLLQRVDGLDAESDAE